VLVQVLERLRRLGPRAKLRFELEKVRFRVNVLAAERDAHLHQRDESVRERNEFFHQRDIERNELLRQRDVALRESNEYLRQRDIALGERNEFLRQRDQLVIERDRLLAEHKRPAMSFSKGRTAQPSIFIATLPKSGTVFTRTAIVDAAGLEVPPIDTATNSANLSGYCNAPNPYSRGDFTSEHLNLPALRHLQPNGFVWVSHCPPTHHNLCTLRDAGFDKVTALVRDPRDATVSWTYHLRTMARSMMNYNSFIQHLPVDYFHWLHADQLAFQVRTFLPTAVNWIEGWAGASMQNLVRVHFVLFDELRTQPQFVFQRIFEFHGVSEFDLAKVPAPEPGKRHFRKGESGAWRNEFSESDKAFANNLIGSRLDRVFDRTPG
jgi:hypothetical protein